MKFMAENKLKLDKGTAQDIIEGSIQDMALKHLKVLKGCL